MLQLTYTGILIFLAKIFAILVVKSIVGVTVVRAVLMVSFELVLCHDSQ